MTPNELQDEFDRTSIDQLHKVVLHISGNCFELKKLCATVLVAVATLIATFTHQQLDYSFFLAGALIASFFWILDAQSYYYQAKIRDRMKVVANGMAARHSPVITVPGIGMPVPTKADTAGRTKKVFRACFNPSMIFYLIIVALIAMVALLFAKGLVR